ncbi:MAG: SRPBCC family protein [Micromonosporaceae bacterium]|jgi:uncharacterized protein YndB with AHSA1/START domain|nr:SRPBCC family protein [Micromonosporaceae bacterium]
MARQRIDVKVTTPADPDTVYKLLADPTTWPTWSPIGSYAEEPGSGDRLFRTGRITSRERVVEADPGRRLSYELVSGLAIRQYRADIDLAPVDGGTSIHWHSSFLPKVPGTGWLYRRTLQRFVEQCAKGLAEYAARSGASR